MSRYFFSQVFSGAILDSINIVAFNPGPLLVIGYAVRRTPFAARSIFAGIQQVHVNLEEAAFNLGARKFKTVRFVVLPLIALNGPQDNSWPRGPGRRLRLHRGL